MTGFVKNESVHGYPTTAQSYNDSTGMTTRLFNVDTRAGLHIDNVSDLVHQGLHLDDDGRLGRNTLLEENRSRKAEYDSDIRIQEEKLILRNRELENSQMVRFKQESELVAMSSVGESFLFPVGICMREQDLQICDIRGIELHRQALTCAESLLTDSEDILDICKQTAVIVTPMRQEYVYHELENRVSVFSHVKENFTVSCGDTTSQHCLGKGLNSVLLPVGCELLRSNSV